LQHLLLVPNHGTVRIRAGHRANARARQYDLTGAFNGQHFFARCKRILQRLEKSHDVACVLIVDVDHFKRVNDLHGHISGDTVLQNAVAICQSVLRASDVFRRLGGEEFGILMPSCARTQGIAIGNRIRQAIANTCVQVHEQATVTITASFGLACTDMTGYALKPLLIEADTALFAAKHAGRNQLIAGTGVGAPKAAPVSA
jgi:diguanylate cyclase (GGDEF)-like protein